MVSSSGRQKRCLSQIFSSVYVSIQGSVVKVRLSVSLVHFLLDIVCFSQDLGIHRTPPSAPHALMKSKRLSSIALISTGQKQEERCYSYFSRS